MAKSWKISGTVICLICGVFFSSCDVREDPGPIQRAEETYAFVDFDRLEIGDALVIKVEQSNFFSISAKGDRRNLNDLDVYKDGSTLVIRFDESGERKHETQITITMPSLKAVNFSGASYSTIKGFAGDDKFSFVLSGASVSQADISATEVDAVISGASNLTLKGTADELNVQVSGASELNAFTFDANDVEVEASGASKVRILANEALKATATGASLVLYRGNPSVTSTSSGASSVVAD